MVSNKGALALPVAGGVSSSASLTGAFTMGLLDLLGIPLSLDQIALSDFGEYYLGKRAGAADKVAQLNARRGEIVIVGSLPEKCLGRLAFPPQVAVILAKCPVPRLTTAAGHIWLQKQLSDTFTSTDISIVLEWAKSVMIRSVRCPPTYKHDSLDRRATLSQSICNGPTT